MLKNIKKIKKIKKIKIKIKKIIRLECYVFEKYIKNVKKNIKY